MAKKSFVFYENWGILLSNLNDTDAGILIKAICAYQHGECVEIENETLNAIFQSWIPRMDEDAQAYDDVREKRRAAAFQKYNKEKEDTNKSMQMDANASKSMQMDANACKCMQMDYVTDTVTDTVTVTDNASALDISGARDVQNPEQTVIDAYNETCKDFPHAQNNERISGLIRERLAFQDMEMVLQAFKKAAASDFLARSRFCDLEWILRIDNFKKILDGRYDNGERASPRPRRVQNFDNTDVDYDALAAGKVAERLRHG
jgi:hypothetical protein